MFHYNTVVGNNQWQDKTVNSYSNNDNNSNNKQYSSIQMHNIFVFRSGIYQFISSTKQYAQPLYFIFVLFIDLQYEFISLICWQMFQLNC